MNSFAMLVDLAKEKSSEKRRELMRQVTDSFLTTAEPRTDREAELFDEIVGALTADLETQVRVDLAKKVAASRLSIRRTALRLANDVIDVARPVLESSRALTQADLVEVVRAQSQEHMMAVTRRDDIGEHVSSALVAKGSDPVVASLLNNQTARISRETYERVAERAQTSVALQSPLVKRESVPLEVLNLVYSRVSADLRKEILSKFQGASEAQIQSALQSAKEHVAEAYGALPRDYQLAKEHVDDMEKRNALQPSSLEALLRSNNRTAFLIAFARLVGVDFDLATRHWDAKDVDAIALLCRAATFPRPVFVTLCMMMLGGSGGLQKAEAHGRMFEQVPVESAQRAIRFWKIRASGGANQAAA
ncbi:MAG TPA: DUF2336 domain-containing protein [Hyphomonadaceae bacterium]|nr:DUF2336 domain-containing protein [Hyphomonadaceae bacterium]HPN05551.1 DUF2336 domain-containing protein [Hyphomonadaceae bacterium]